MDNGRSPVSRREPVVITNGLGRTIEVRPLPWRKRNDLGQLIVREYSAAIQRYVDLTKDDKNKALEADFFDGILDWDKIFATGLPDDSIDDLTWDELIEVGLAMLKVNGLDSQAWMIDPKLRSQITDTLSASNETAATPENGVKTTSSPDSGSTDTVENPSTTSPIMSSSPS